MKICELDNQIKSLVDEYHVYGAECVIVALVRACNGDKYLNAQSLHTLVESAFMRVDTEEEIDD